MTRRPIKHNDSLFVISSMILARRLASDSSLLNPCTKKIASFSTSFLYYLFCSRYLTDFFPEINL
jgi:hypothetical protein